MFAATFISAAPSSAESPAQHCKRETAAYNTAWVDAWTQANPGKSSGDTPPPVSYRCDSGNAGDPPPTSQDKPATRALRSPTAQNLSSAAENDTRAESDSERVEQKSLQYLRRNELLVTDQIGRRNSDSPLDNPGAYDFSGDFCSPGYHRNNYGAGHCFPDYDYNVSDVRFVEIRPIPGEGHIAYCKGSPNSGCTLTYTNPTVVTNTVTRSSEVSAEAGFSVEEVNAKVGSGISESHRRSLRRDEQPGGQLTIPKEDLRPPNYEVMGYRQYAMYEYRLEKYNTQTKRVEWSRIYDYYVPVGIEAVPA